MTSLADDLVPDQLWELVEPLLPAPPRPPYGGRHRTISDRACLAAIVFMARTSTPWRLLPARELGCIFGNADLHEQALHLAEPALVLHALGVARDLG